MGARKVNDDRLYRALDQLLPHKTELEKHLKSRLGELFDLKYDLLLYDLTSTYFEGQAEGNELARRGYSRDSRGDCKQVCIGLVVSRCGMPLGYEMFAGNKADVTGGAGDRREDGSSLREGRSDLGDGPGDGVAGQRRVPQGRQPPLHHGHAKGDVAKI